MAFQTFPVNVAGPSYQSRSRALSSQSTINFYQEFDEKGKSPFVIHSWPGEDLFGAVTGIDRGQHTMAGVIYRVSGTQLFEVDNSGAHTDRGLIPGVNRCIFANDGEDMFIVSVGNVQQYNRISKLLTDVTDSDIDGAISVDFLNNQFIYAKPDLFIVSDVGNGASASGLNAAQAESQPDELIRAFVFDQVAYMLGGTSTEPFYNTGTGQPPFDRIDTQIISIGLSALHSVASNDSFMYWLGDDRQVYQTAGGSTERVSNIGIAHAFEGYDVVSDAVGWTMTLEGQNFYVISFPAENQTWALNEGLGRDGWFQLSSDTLGGKYNGTSHSFLGGDHFIADELNGNLYKLNLETFDNNGEIIQRTRTLSSIHGGLINQPGKRIQMSRFELIMEKGVGLISGQGEDPKIIIERSIDGGKSFQTQDHVSIGRQGESNILVEWFNLESFYDLIIRISTTDPVQYTMFSGAIDLRLAGK